MARCSCGELEVSDQLAKGRCPPIPEKETAGAVTERNGHPRTKCAEPRLSSHASVARRVRHFWNGVMQHKIQFEPRHATRSWESTVAPFVMSTQWCLLCRTGEAGGRAAAVCADALEGNTWTPPPPHGHTRGTQHNTCINNINK